MSTALFLAILFTYIMRSHLPSVLYRHTSDPLSSRQTRNSAFNTCSNYCKDHRKHHSKARQTNDLLHRTLPRKLLVAFTRRPAKHTQNLPILQGFVTLHLRAVL